MEWQLVPTSESPRFRDTRAVLSTTPLSVLSLKYMGHANISITLDRYGHLIPGNEDEAAGLLDAYLARTAAVEAAVERQECAPLAASVRASHALTRWDYITPRKIVLPGAAGARPWLLDGDVPHLTPIGRGARSSCSRARSCRSSPSELRRGWRSPPDGAAC